MSILIYDWKINGGSHIKYEGNLENTIKNALTSGMNSCQFFLGNPQSFNRSKISEEDIKKAKELSLRYNLKCFSHAPYIHNLCGSKACACWSGNDLQDQKTQTAIKSLEYELDILGCINGGVVLHPGVFSDRKKGTEIIKQSIQKIQFKDHYKLLLENSAGQGDSLGVIFSELKSMIPPECDKNIGICLDTAHIWGAGVYDLRKESEIVKMFTNFDEIFGLSKLELVHLNDSMVPFSSRKDRHELITKGEIWKKDITSFKILLKNLERRNIPFVLETEPEDYEKVYSIYAK